MSLAISIALVLFLAPFYGAMISGPPPEDRILDFLVWALLTAAFALGLGYGLASIVERIS